MPYYPSILETFKFAFLRWAAFVIIAGFVFSTIVNRLAKEGALEVKIRDEKVKWEVNAIKYTQSKNLGDNLWTTNPINLAWIAFFLLTL